MSDSDLAERLDAVERALTDDETDLDAVRDAAERDAAVDRLETRVDDLETTVEELEAAVEAVRGYAGNVRAVNREVERRASAALAKAETVERAVQGADPAALDQPVGTDATRGAITENHSPQATTTDERSEADSCRAIGVGTGHASDCSATGHGGDTPVDSPTDGRSWTERESRAPAGGGAPVAAGRDRSRDSDVASGPDASSTGSSDSCQATAGASNVSQSNTSHSRAKRSTGDADDQSGHRGRSTAASTDESASQTEQFIERVRDAL